MENYERLIGVARGKYPADIILTNGRVVNVFTGEIETCDVALCGERIAGVGHYHDGASVINLEGRYLIPGLINGHVHIESSLLDVPQYAQAIVPHGTTTVITDLHEIANVSGLHGLRYILGQAQHLPLKIFLMAPSCVPATNLETSGAEIGHQEILNMLSWDSCLGLGEMMNVKGVINADPLVLRKLRIEHTHIIDGHAPGLSGRDLNAYISAGIGSDHESTTLNEAKEKLQRGMYIMVREGSSEKNLEAILPLVDDKNYLRFILVVDDRTATDLKRDGDIDGVVRKAIALGLDPVKAVRMATLNPATYFGLRGYGAVAPGYLANLVVLDDIRDFNIDRVFFQGREVAQEGRATFSHSPGREPELPWAMHVKPFMPQSLRLRCGLRNMPVIEVVPGQIITRKVIKEVLVSGGEVVSDTRRDILKLAVVERHHASGNIGLGLVSGIGLKKGAIASSVAHDSHNIIAVGVEDTDLFRALKEVELVGGGLVAVAEGQVESLPLPVAGLLSNATLDEVVSKLESLDSMVHRMGSTLESPFATLSFLALPVIPELRLTDKGLVDVKEGRLIGLG